MDKLRVNEHRDISMLPNHLVNDGGLTAEALAAIVWILSQPSEYTFRVPDIQKRFGWGGFLWRRISTELKTHGILSFGYVDGRRSLTLGNYQWQD